MTHSSVSTLPSLVQHTQQQAYAVVVAYFLSY